MGARWRCGGLGGNLVVWGAYLFFGCLADNQCGLGGLLGRDQDQSVHHGGDYCLLLGGPCPGPSVECFIRAIDTGRWPRRGGVRSGRLRSLASPLVRRGDEIAEGLAVCLDFRAYLNEFSPPGWMLIKTDCCINVFPGVPEK